MIKLLLTLIMMFTFGTTTVNAEENTTNIEDRISELAEVKSEDSQSVINAKLDELSEDELKTVIANVNELTEPTEDDLVIKEPAVSAILELAGVEEMESEEYVTRHNFPIILLFSLGLATLIFFILVNLGLISQD